MSNKDAQNIVSKLRQLSFNFDLTLAYINGEKDFSIANINYNMGKKSSGCQRRVIENKIRLEQLEIFEQEILNAKKEMLENLDLILAKYQDRYKDVFKMYFLENRTHQEIADLTGYSLPNVNKIVSKLKSELLDFYIY